MRWNWRQDWRALLGLLALAVQLIAGFAHHHFHHTHVDGEPHSHLAEDAHLADAVGLSLADLPAFLDHRGHDTDHPHSDGDVACDICLALAALRTSRLPDSLTVFPPSTVTVSLALVRVRVPRTAVWRANGARAPPGGLTA